MQDRGAKFIIRNFVLGRLSRCGYLVIVLSLGGCAAGYSGFMKSTLKSLERGDYQRALEQLEANEDRSDKLLYRMEKGLIYHYQGAYEASNKQFAKAEDLIDRRYTKSVSRELAAFVTNDAIRHYTGEEFERALIHYYRAMNYEKLGLRQEALVECRKANLRLEDYAAGSKYTLNYKNDAFLQYMTGLFYEADGDINEAYISYKDAELGYRAYHEAFGVTIPSVLVEDLTRAAARLGYRDDLERYMQRYGRYGIDPHDNAVGDVVIFVESGRVPRKLQQEINLPILESDDTRHAGDLSERMVYRRHRHHHYERVEYWLKVATPYYQEAGINASAVRQVRVRGGGLEATGVLVESVGAIARRSLRDKEDAILARTVARAITKYVLSEKAEDESEVLGFLVNLFGVATEAADTRSWLSLPDQVYMVRFSPPPGTVDLVVEFLNGRGQVVETGNIPLVRPDAEGTTFLSYRSYR